MNSIWAKRGEDTKEFTPEVWADLPKDKYGWKILTEEPEEVKRLREAKNKPEWDTLNDQPLGMIPFTMEGDLGKFDEKFMPQLQNLGLTEEVARNLSSALWHFGNGQWSAGSEVGKDELNTVQNNANALQEQSVSQQQELLLNKDKIAELEEQLAGKTTEIISLTNQLKEAKAPAPETKSSTNKKA